MSPEEREVVTRSIANLWTFNAVFISQLLYSLRKGAMRDEEIEALLQAVDEETDAVLEGEDDKLYAAGLLASVRSRLSQDG